MQFKSWFGKLKSAEAQSFQQPAVVSGTKKAKKKKKKLKKKKYVYSSSSSSSSSEEEYTDSDSSISVSSYDKWKYMKMKKKKAMRNKLKKKKKMKKPFSDDSADSISKIEDRGCKRKREKQKRSVSRSKSVEKITATLLNIVEVRKHDKEFNTDNLDNKSTIPLSQNSRKYQFQ